MNGILLVDKPAGLTSHDVVDRIRKASGVRRVGHTGTLDPAATGLLILCIGPATRLSEFLIGLDKVYEGAMRLGLVTDSYDLDGEVIEERPVPDSIDSTVLETAFAKFTGDIKQVPPMVSAVKVKGKRLYKLARQGETVEREPRPVRISEFTLLSYTQPDAAFRLRCSRGTYARTLCYDVGERLGCGATLAKLRRTAVGTHRIEDALPLDALTAPKAVQDHMRPVDNALDLPAVTLAPEGRRALAHGNALHEADLIKPCSVDEGWIQLKTASGRLLALGVAERGPSGVTVRPKRVLSASS